MATNTFDTSRVGGGTYELEQDANGNYKLKSVGFQQINKLTLPDLTSKDKTIGPITKLPVDPGSGKVDEPFKQLFKQTEDMGKGGGQDYSGVMLKTPEVKDATVRDAGEMRKEQIKKAGGVETSKGQMYATDAGFQIAEDQKRDDVIASDANVGFDTTYKSPTMAMKEQEFAQGKYTPKATGLQKVKSKASDALTKVSDTLQKVSQFSPVRIAAKALGALVGGILPEATPTQKLNKSYFNVREDGRIAGNPATDLYAGFNRTSDFGNLEKAGNKRLATRQKTIERKGYKPGDKFYDDTEKMKEQAKDYKQKKTETQKATQGPAGSGGDGGGSDSGRVICTDLHRTGELSTRDWIRDTKFTFKTLSIKHVKGYLLWAEPTVRHIQKYPRYRKIWKHIAQHRANDIAWRLNEGKFDLLGRIYAGIGEPVCWMLGNFVSDKQISKYNLTHWRRI